MKSQVPHTMWCNITGEAAGEVWHWSLSGVKGLKWGGLIRPRSPCFKTPRLALDFEPIACMPCCPLRRQLLSRDFQIVTSIHRVYGTDLLSLTPPTHAECASSSGRNSKKTNSRTIRTMNTAMFTTESQRSGRIVSKTCHEMQVK